MEDGTPEIYLAVQGEGKTIGKPMVFVRFSLCNLHCKFCDTFYTWNFENTPWKHDFAPKCQTSKEIIELNVEEVVSCIKEVAGINKNVIFTGGEPTLHQKEIKEIIGLLPGWYFEIETNGTILFDNDLIKYIDQINCSPKLENSGNDLERRFKQDVLTQIKENNGIFKFVISDQESVDEAEEIISAIDIPSRQVFFMPQGIKREEIIEGSLKLNELCMAKGYNMSTRLQVILYNTKRAV